MRGLFISIEGPEGAGKTTQTNLLCEWFAAQGLEVLYTREPGDGCVGGQIRKIILDPANCALTAKAEAMLYAADRAQHVERVLLPALKAGKVVLCDRYVDSHIAYQGYGRGLDLEFLRELNRMATGGLMPHLTVLLRLSPEEGLARLIKHRHKDRMEQEEIEFHHRLCAGYDAIAAANPKRVCVIDAKASIIEVRKAVVHTVAGLLMQAGYEVDINR